MSDGVKSTLKRLILPVAVLALVMSTQVYLVRVVGGFTPRIELNAEDYGLGYEASITVSELESERLNVYRPSFRKTLRGNVGGVDANIIVTNGDYAVYKEFAVTMGSFFTQAASEIGLNLAVISEGLSFETFRTTNSVGNEIDINGLSYKVVGVYKQDGLASLLTSDGRESVYVPANSDFDIVYGRSATVQSVLITPPRNVPPSLVEQDAAEALARVSGNSGNYLVKDFTMSGVIVGQFVRIEVILLFVCAVFFAVRFLLRDVKKVYEDYSQTEFKARQGLSAYVSDNVTTLLTLLLKWVVIAFAGLFSYRFAAFDLYVPGKFVSSERLLDFGFYKNIVVTAIHDGNLFYAYKQSSYEKLFSFALVVNAGFFVVFVVATVATVRRLCFVPSASRKF